MAFNGRKEYPDTQYVPFSSNENADPGKELGFRTDVREVWFAGSHSGMCIDVPSRYCPNRHRIMGVRLLMIDRVRRWGWLSEGHGSKRAVEHSAALDDARDRQGEVRHPFRRNRARAVEHPDRDDQASDQDARTVLCHSAWQRVRAHARAGDAGQVS